LPLADGRTPAPLPLQQRSAGPCAPVQRRVHAPPPPGGVLPVPRRPRQPLVHGLSGSPPARPSTHSLPSPPHSPGHDPAQLRRGTPRPPRRRCPRSCPVPAAGQPRGASRLLPPGREHPRRAALLAALRTPPPPPHGPRHRRGWPPPPLRPQRRVRDAHGPRRR